MNAKVIEVRLVEQFSISFTVRSIGRQRQFCIRWTDGPALSTVEKFVQSIGIVDVQCGRNMSFAYVDAIVATFCAHENCPPEKVKINENSAGHAWVDASALLASNELVLRHLLSTVDSKDIHHLKDIYPGERQKVELEEEWEEEQNENRRKQEERVRQYVRRFSLFSPFERIEALSLLGIPYDATEEQIKAAFRAKVKASSDGKGGYIADMDVLTTAKEKALQCSC